MSDIQSSSSVDIATQAVLLKALIDLAMEELSLLKQRADFTYAAGETAGAFEGLEELGTLGKSAPKPVAKIVDREEFEGWLSTKHGDQLERSVVLGDHAEIAAVLADTGHDDLYSVVESIPDELVKKVLKLAERGGNVPGVELRTPGSVMSVKPNRAAKARVREALIASAVPFLAIEGDVNA